MSRQFEVFTLVKRLTQATLALSLLGLITTGVASANPCDRLHKRPFEEALAEAYNEATNEVSREQFENNLGLGFQTRRPSATFDRDYVDTTLDTVSNHYEDFRAAEEVQSALDSTGRDAAQRRTIDEWYQRELRSPGANVDTIEAEYQRRLDEFGDQIESAQVARTRPISSVLTPSQLASVGYIDPTTRVQDAIPRLGQALDRLRSRIERLRQDLRNHLRCNDDDDEGNGSSGLHSGVLFPSCSPARGLLNRQALPAEVRDTVTQGQRSLLDIINEGRATPITQEQVDRLIESYEGSAHSLEGMAGFHMGISTPGRGLGGVSALEGVGIGALPRVLAWLRNLAPAGGLTPAAAMGAFIPAGAQGATGVPVGIPGITPPPQTPSRPTVPRSRPRSNKPGPSAKPGCQYVGTGTLNPAQTEHPVLVSGGRITFISRCYDRSEIMAPEDLHALVTARKVSSTRAAGGELDPSWTMTTENPMVALSFEDARPSPSTSRNEGLYDAYPFTAFWPVTITEQSDTPSTRTVDLSRPLLSMLNGSPPRTSLKITSNRSVTSQYSAPVHLNQYPC